METRQELEKYNKEELTLKAERLDLIVNRSDGKKLKPLKEDYINAILEKQKLIRRERRKNVAPLKLKRNLY